MIAMIAGRSLCGFPTVSKSGASAGFRLSANWETLQPAIHMHAALRDAGLLGGSDD